MVREEWSGRSGHGGVVNEEWSGRSGQGGVVREEWSGRSGQGGVVMGEWSMRSGQEGVVREEWSGRSGQGVEGISVCTLTSTVASIFPLRPSRGAQIFSSMSHTSVTHRQAAPSPLVPSDGLVDECEGEQESTSTHFHFLSSVCVCVCVCEQCVVLVVCSLVQNH